MDGLAGGPSRVGVRYLFFRRRLVHDMYCTVRSTLLFSKGLLGVVRWEMVQIKKIVKINSGNIEIIKRQEI